MIDTSNIKIYFYFSPTKTLIRDFITNDYSFVEKYHNDLNPADNSAKIKIPFDVELSDLLKAVTGKVKVEIKQFGQNKMSGYLRNTFTFTKTQRNQPISLEIVNPSFNLDVDIDKPVFLINKKVDEIVIHLLSLAGFSAYRAFTIANVIPFFGMEVGENIYDTLAILCKEYGYTFTFDADGFFLVQPLFNSPSGIVANVFNGTNCLDEIKIVKSEEKADGVSVEWNKIEYVENTLIFSDTQNGNATYKCIIQVPPNQFLFDKEENFLEYDSTLGEIKYVSAFTPQIVSDSQIQILKLENLGSKALLSAKNISSSGQFRITKLDIIGNAYINRGTNISNKIVGSKKIEKVSAKYLFNEADINKYVSNLLNYYKYSDYEIELTSKTNYPLGSFVSVSDTGIGTTTGRIISKKMGLQSEAIDYVIEAIREYQIEVILPSIGNVITDGNQTAQEIYDELKNGNVPIGVNNSVSDITAPSIPVIALSLNNTNGTISITFNASTDLESGVSFYKVYRKGIESIFSTVATITHIKNQLNYVFTDVNTKNNVSYEYKISAVDCRGNESNPSPVATVISVVSIPPYDALTITALADNADNIKLSASVNATLDPIYKADSFVYQISRNNGTTWSDIETSKTNSCIYYFNRTTDGYTEKATLANYRFRVAVKSVYGISSNFILTTPITTLYQTWIPSQPILATRASGRNGSLSWDKQTNIYGLVEYEMQISKDNTNWYKPANDLIASASVDNWKSGLVNESLIYPTESYSQGLPLIGQNSIPTIVADTLYYYRVKRVNKTTGIKSAFTTSSLTATATSAKDIVNNAINTNHIVNDAITADKIFVNNLSAITANLGIITDGALGSNANNKWDLTAGTFKVGDGVNNVLSFDPATGLKVRTSSFESATLSTKMSGNFTVGTGIGTGTVFSVKPAESLVEINGSMALDGLCILNGTQGDRGERGIQGIQGIQGATIPDISGLGIIDTVDGVNDSLIIYDGSTGLHRKVAPNNMPVSTATQTALNTKANASSITNVDNTRDADKTVLNVSTPTAGYKHLGAWGVGRAAIGAILVNTAYCADIASNGYLIRAMYYDNGGDVRLLNSVNVSAIVKLGQGIIKIIFSKPMSIDGYCVSATSRELVDNNENAYNIRVSKNYPPTVNDITLSYGYYVSSNVYSTNYIGYVSVFI